MIKQELIDSIFSALNAKKYVAESFAEDNLQKALNNPNFKQCYNYIRTLEYEIAKLDYLKQDSRALRSDLKLWTAKKEEILKSLGVRENDMVPNYSCKRCQDTGIVGDEYCICFKKLLSLGLLNNSGLSKSNLHSFSKVNYDIISEKFRNNAKDIYDIVEKFTSNLGQSNINMITISGPTGVGKTHLCGCAANSAISKGYYTYYTTAFNLSNDMLSYHCSKVEDRAKILESYIDCEFLIIDDLGTEPMLNNVTKEYLYLIINERSNKKLKTLITTNLYPREILDRYEERIFSRIANKNECILLHLDGDDLRVNI